MEKTKKEFQPEIQTGQKYARTGKVHRHSTYELAKKNRDSLLKSLEGKDVRVKIRARSNGKFDTVTYERIQPKK